MLFAESVFPQSDYLVFIFLQCADGISGSGTCLCEPGYTGTACDTRITNSETNSVEPTFHPRAPERSGTGSQSDSDEDSVSVCTKAV